MRLILITVVFNGSAMDERLIDITDVPRQALDRATESKYCTCVYYIWVRDLKPGRPAGDKAPRDMCNLIPRDNISNY